MMQSSLPPAKSLYAVSWKGWVMKQTWLLLSKKPKIWQRHWGEPSADNWLLARILNMFFPNAREIHCYMCCIRAQYWLQRGVKKRKSRTMQVEKTGWKCEKYCPSVLLYSIHENPNHQNEKNTNLWRDMVSYRNIIIDTALYSANTYQLNMLFHEIKINHCMQTTYK